MTTDLRAVLAELAEQAPDYSRPDRAVASARRTRAGWTIGSVCAGLAIALVAGVGAVQWRGAGSDPVADDGSVRVVVGERAPARLPAGGVGDARARLVYDTCVPTCSTRLVLVDGRQFTIAAGDEQKGMSHLIVSPDGRWLAWHREDDDRAVTLLDLSTGARREDPTIARVVGWAPDSSRLLAVRNGPDLAVVQVLERSQSPIQLPYPAGYVLRDDDLVVIEPAGAGGATIGRWLDRANPVMSSVSWSGLLRPGETVSVDSTSVLPAPDGGEIAIPILFDRRQGVGGNIDFAVTGYLIMDPDRPDSIRRLDAGTEKTVARAIGSGGILAEEWIDVGSRWSGPSFGVKRIVSIDVTTGAVRPAVTFSRAVMAGVIVPGGR